MAEFCLECWNKLNKTDDSPKKYIFSKRLELCENCGEWKHIIIAGRKLYCIGKTIFRFCPFYKLK